MATVPLPRIIQSMEDCHGVFWVIPRHEVESCWMDFWSSLQRSLVSDGGYIGSHGISIIGGYAGTCKRSAVE